ncbi:MAG: hypothetical protein B7Z55_04195 [Planctomycetales bacterium 12-60-4]|nr:MAG: hypothetical protein B7Z55_04195 [Planctomycetales bacterium 12-60-4]
MATVILRALWLAVALQMAVGTSRAAEPPAPNEAAAAESAPVQAADNEAAAAVRERRRNAYAGLMALMGIALTGVGLVAIVVIWGRHLRRANRKPLPSADLKDELWFLRARQDVDRAERELTTDESQNDED